MGITDRAWNLPNALTVLRIFLVPLLVVVLLTRFEWHLYFGAAIYGLAVLTDFLDGFFARRRNQVTRLGIVLDPLADKLLNAAALLSLVELGLAPAWVVMIILAREIAVTGLRNVAAGRGLLIGASGLGKAKMVAQVTALVGVVVVAHTLYTSTMEHIKEFGTVKAIGGGNGDIYRILGTQASIALKLIVPGDLALTVFAGTLLLCLVSAFVSFRKVARIDPALVFRT